MTVERGSLYQEGAESYVALPTEERMEHEVQPDTQVQGRRYSNGIANGIGNGYLAVQEPTQLPSPSPSPSPRSGSPSMAVTEDAPAEYSALLSAPHGHRYPESLEKASGGSLLGGEKEEVILASPLPISKTFDPEKLEDIPEEKVRKPRRLSTAKANGEVLKLSASEMEELMSQPESLPVTSPAKLPSLSPAPIFDRRSSETSPSEGHFERARKISAPESLTPTTEGLVDRRARAETTSNPMTRRPGASSRAISSPISSGYSQSFHSKPTSGQTSPKRKPVPLSSRPEPLDLSHVSSKNMGKSSGADLPSPIPQSIPLPPMSIPTYLQLELSSTRPSPLYIYRSAASEFPYESSKVKFERLLNFLLLPPQLERVLYFGTLACLDAWLYTFTILPLRFFKAAWILIQWWGQVLAKEARFIMGFIYHGTGRMWHRSRGRRESMDSIARSRSASRASRPSASTAPSYQSQSGRTLDIPVSHGTVQNGNIEHLKAEIERKTKPIWGRRHRRTKSQPSSLSSYHKADLLQGAVIICSCMILMKLDASRMYHSIRGQAAIKLYVIFNVLEVFDKLLAALGQDILECLFSNETLERDTEGRSKILRPMGMFILALIYNVVHAAALFYQVITLNVAVNSYSNALLTLLMSNQFVEIKGTVFKKIEKDNLFQLTCADIVERFQLWLMLMIIALRNIVEVGGLSMIGGGGPDGDMMNAAAPARSNSIMPNSFTILPSWSGEVLSPFLLVLGSEMLVDWIKHSYTAKFNNVKPAVYNRYLDVLAKDYYTNAFVNQNLVKRLGLPVIPLSCLFIRSAFQTYHMFLATHIPPPIPLSSTTSSSTSLSESSSPSTTAALEHFDTIIRRALGRSTFGFGPGTGLDGDGAGYWSWMPDTDSILAATTMLVFFLGLFLVLLALKLVLGMLLLKFARNRYKSMKKREHESQKAPEASGKEKEKENYNTEGRRLGSWGMTEMDEDKKRWIYDDDKEHLRVMREKEQKWREKSERMGMQEFGKISRYEMVKRIW
ncbi:related to membrane protein [Phialocephala subalpina]|uniref:Related to membrane protein n=1 Tax=Phialocephala subalpina TaxID=576137 RepID=A0A1L7WHM6_9HELO|nr:related to membrane protein [Phialocephala subalpina]